MPIPMPSPRPHGVGVAITLGVVALVLAGFAGWAGSAAGSSRREADRLTAEAARVSGEARKLADDADVSNQALTDTAKTSEVAGQVRDVVEKALSFNYADMERTAKAARENLDGAALCEYDKLFGPLRTLAPEQKIVLTTKVREIGVTRLEGDSAELLVFIDQTSTRADQNQTAASGAQFGLGAGRMDGHWKITRFNMLGQPLPNGQPVPQC